MERVRKSKKGNFNKKVIQISILVVLCFISIPIFETDLSAATLYIITAGAGPNGSISPSGTTSVAEGTDQTYTITPNPGFKVAALVVDGTLMTGAVNYTFNGVANDHYINAYFETLSASYAITAGAGPNGSISPSGTTSVAGGTDQTYTITPNPGFKVAALVVDGTLMPGAVNYTFNGVASEHYINAYFEAVSATETIISVAGPNGTISPEGSVPVSSGSSQTFTITPITGYNIADVKVDGVSVGAVSSYTFSNVTATHTIAASFTNSTYAITATAGSGGSISPSGTVLVNSGDSQTFTITPNSGYTISDVTVDGVSKGVITSGTFADVNATHTIAATFAINGSSINITIDSPSDGATFNRPDVMVAGTVTNAGGYETGVTVNGVVANVYGNNFVANHVPLMGGTNTITATAIDINGAAASATATVNAAASGYYISLTADTASGVAPLASTLRIDGSFSIGNSSISVTGPVQPEFLSSSADTYQVQMTLEGIYYFTASVTGPDGNPYQDTIAVAAMNATALDNLLRGKWTAMVTSLGNKDITSALAYISPDTRVIYQQMYTAIIDQLPAMVATQTAFNYVSVKNNAAIYSLETLENGTVYSYEVVFVKGANGLWVIYDF